MKHILNWQIFESMGSNLTDAPGIWEFYVSILGIDGDFENSYIVAAKNFREALEIIDSECGGYLTNGKITDVFPGFLEYQSELDFNKNAGDDLLEIGKVSVPDIDVEFDPEYFEKITFRVSKKISGEEMETSGSHRISSHIMNDPDVTILGSPKIFGKILADLFSNPINSWYVSGIWNLMISPPNLIYREKKRQAFGIIYPEIKKEFFDQLEKRGLTSAYTNIEKLKDILVKNNLFISKQDQISENILDGKSIGDAFSLAVQDYGDSILVSRSSSAKNNLLAVIEELKNDMTGDNYKIASAVLRYRDRII
jgi:hypothetical protein